MRKLSQLKSVNGLFKVLLILVLFFVQNKAYCSSFNDPKISLNLNQVTLFEAFEEIENKTGYKFFYKDKEIDLTKKITIKIENKPLTSVLKTLFEDDKNTFELFEELIIITKRGRQESSKDNSQKNEITGIVIDKETGKTIPFCNIALVNTYNGTATNEQGAFSIVVDSFPIKIIFSHINYEKTTVTVSKAEDILVELKPLVKELQEVVLLSSGRDEYAIELAKKAFQKINKNKKVKYGKALYRQKTKNGERYVELAEIIYDIRYNEDGIEDWEILEGRYAINDENGIHNKNYTLLSRLMRVLQPDTDDIMFPIHSELETYYDVRLIDKIKSDKNEIAILWFKPNEKNNVPTFEAEVYIDTKTNNVLKIAANISRDDVKLMKLRSKGASWKDYKLSFELTYKQDSIDNMQLDYINTHQEFDYYKDDVLKFHVSSNSNLTLYEYYTPTSKKRLGKQFKKNKSDWDKLNEIGYNKKFWEDNPIVKRTPVEEEVIAAFEKDSAFGSIFLNSREQVALMQSNISGDSFIKTLEKQVNRYNSKNPNEKVFLHTDKDIFLPEETLWYSGYAVLGSYHEYSLASKVIHVDLIDSNNNIVISQTQKLIGGRCKGSIDIPKNLPSGNYYLRSYTNWMRNYDDAFFFTKQLKIINSETTKISSSTNDNLDVQFFPEGGYAVNNLMGVIAFKAIGKDGFSKSIKGRIVDSKNQQIASVTTLDRGAGFFFLKPKEGEQYAAIFDNGFKYALPKAEHLGYVMTVNNSSRRSIKVKVQASNSLKGNKFYVVGHIHNKKYFQGKFNFGGKDLVEFEIPKTKLPSGVMTLSLFDENKKAWCERLVFINNQEELVINTVLSVDKFNKRDKIILGIHVTDTDGRPVPSSLSVALTDANQVIKSPNSGNILTQLLLQSDVKGHIENPASFFKDQKKSSLLKLDLVMLTHGWRRFNWDEIWNPLTNYSAKFDFSKGLTISGIVKNLNNKVLSNTTLKVIAKRKDELAFYPTKTKADGRFLIDNFNFTDSTHLVFNTYNKKQNLINSKVTLDKRENILPISNYKYSNYNKAYSNQEEEYLKNGLKRKRYDSIFNLNKLIELEEVTVNVKKNRSKSADPSIYGIIPDATEYTDGTTTSLFQLLRRVVGVQVVGSNQEMKVSIRGGGSPLWVVDGMIYSDVEEEVSDEGESTNEYLKNHIPGPVPFSVINLNIFDIERIEVLKGPSGTVFGSRGANGVILIYSKRGENSSVDISSSNITVFGHAGAKEYYTPKYDIDVNDRKIPDYRATLYWNPVVNTDKEGNAKVTFFNSDTASQIQVDIQGLSIYGTPGAYLETFGE